LPLIVRIVVIIKMHATAMSGVLNYMLLFNVSFQVVFRVQSFHFLRKKN